MLDWKSYGLVHTLSEFHGLPKQIGQPIRYHV